MRYKKFYSHLILLSVAMLGTLTSCSNNDEISQESGDESSELTCVAKNFESSDNFSRSSLTFDSSKGMVFAWTEDDEMTVFGKDDFRATQLYKLEAGSGEPLAKFYAESFRLKPGLMYYAFSKTERTNGHVSIPDQNNITVDYSGQTQTGNANTSHLGAYDFMAAGTVCKDENAAHFTFDHLGSVLRFVMSFDLTSITGEEQNALVATDGNETRFTMMEIYDSENSFRQTKRDFKFSAGASGDSYTFAWPEQEINDMDRFTLTLESDLSGKNGVSLFDKINDKSGSNEASTDKNYRKLITYMEVPPMDFTGKKLGVMLKGYYLKNGNRVDVSYVGVYDKDNFVIKNGKAYQLSLSMKKPDDFNVTLKINHMWQHGNTLDQSRGTGDPGNDDNIVTPKYIYYIYCHDGKVIKPTTAADAQPLTTISGLAASNWDTKNNNGVWISTYKGKGSTDNGIIKLQKPTCSAVGHNCSYHLYVVASNSALTLSGISEGVSEEDVVRELKYNLPNDGVQTFMRDLYSTPWDATNFVGNITDPMQDVTLYHVAAKVDLKWNSTSTLSGNVSVNNVKDSGLYLFKPTENSGNVLSSGGYTVTSTIDEDRMFNGRQVFYLPQFATCTYKVSVGSNTGEITFTPATTGGFTSWLRWLKK